MAVSDLGKACADHILAWLHDKAGWNAAMTAELARQLRRDAAAGMADALRYIAGLPTTSPAARFELETLARDIAPT